MPVEVAERNAADESAPSTPNGSRMRRAPRLYELSLSTTYAPRASLPLRVDGERHRPFGFGAGFRSGWRVSGLDGGAPAWVGFELQFVAQPSPQARESFVLGYGIFAKHEFLPELRFRPFFAYGLGAAQLFVRGVDGRAIGHRTRLGVGFDATLHGHASFAIELTYTMIVMPKLETSTSADRVDRVDQLVLELALRYESFERP